ncbi:hypothetical protein [Streptomyces sulphureus]|uniref:hypothetical protein n=1 Tax=Streptomyces sulphureus TaxID=47758 RepID=UPI000369C753|nr:hypothetical protein [Streptomyces sulphureus]
MHRNAPRHVRTLLCAAAALPVLLVTGCSSDSDGDQDSAAPSASASESAEAPAPAKIKELPDSCKSIKKKTVDSLVPGAENAGGKRVGSGDVGDFNSCLWTGLKKYDYRQLVVTMKRFDSDESLGSGAKRAGEYLTSQAKSVEDNKDLKGAKKAAVKGLGDEATSFSYKTEKKATKKSKEDFQGQHLLVRKDNAVVSVEYEGAGFEGGKMPGADTVKENSEKAAKDALAGLK